MIFRHLIKRSLLGIASAMLLVTCACDRPPASTHITLAGGMDKVANYMQLEEQMGFSGVIAIRQSDHPVFYMGSGFSDREKGTRNNENTIFDIGSLTKQFTGAAILRLEQREKLKVTDSLSKFFHDIPQDKANITIHQLLIHTSGLPWRIGVDFEKLTKEEFLERIYKLDLKHAPGEQYQHSHVGYSLLGVIIEKISGVSYERFLRQEFFTPLEMWQTGYMIPEWNSGEMAHGYRKCRNWGKPTDLNWGAEGPFWNLKANAGLLSTAKDLMTWQHALNSGKVFSDSIYDRYLNPYIQEGIDARSYYSYGWMITKSMRGTPVYAHEGGNGRFFSDWINYPEEDVSILVLSNAWSPGNRKPSNWLIATQLASIVFYPHHEPEVQTKRVECCYDFPDNLTGQIAKNLIDFLSSKSSDSPESLSLQVFGEYVNNKYPNDKIIETLSSMKKDCGPADLRQIVCIDEDFMEIELVRISDQQRVAINLIFDQTDRYRIRKITYNSDLR